MLHTRRMGAGQRLTQLLQSKLALRRGPSFEPGLPEHLTVRHSLFLSQRPSLAAAVQGPGSGLNPYNLQQSAGAAVSRCTGDGCVCCTASAPRWHSAPVRPIHGQSSWLPPLTLHLCLRRRPKTCCHGPQQPRAQQALMQSWGPPTTGLAARSLHRAWASCACWTARISAPLPGKQPRRQNPASQILMLALACRAWRSCACCTARRSVPLPGQWPRRSAAWRALVGRARAPR